MNQTILQSGGENIIGEMMLPSVDLFNESMGVFICLILQAEKEAISLISHSQTLPEKSIINQLQDIYNNYSSQLKEGKPVIFPHLEESKCSIIKSIKGEDKINSLLMMPMLEQKSLLGAVCIYNCQKNFHWTEEQLQIISNTANQWAMTIYQNNLQKQVQLLHEINQIINSSIESTEIIKNILKKIGENFGAERVVIFHLNENKTEVYSCCQTSATLFCDESVDICKSYEAPEWWQKYQKVSVDKDNKKDKKTRKFKRFLLYTLVSVPIFVQEKFFGSLTLQTTSKNKSINEDEKETIEKITQQVAIAIDKAEKEKERLALVKQLQEYTEEKKRDEENNLAKGEYFSQMTHDLRSPLTAILGFARMLKEEIYGTLNAKQIQYVSAIFASGEHMLQLVNNILDLSKIEANREELFIERVPVEEICLASTSIVEERARQQGLELIVDINKSLDFCYADNLRLKQILVNLLTNAIKFTEKGSVTLKVEPKGEMILFSVIDTGIGIKKNDQEKLFQPFSQITNHLSRKHKGTGLGLVLSRNLAKLHGGDLTMESIEGKGTSFTLNLPIKKEYTNNA